jgi:hypothetical protein
MRPRETHVSLLLNCTKRISTKYSPQDPPSARNSMTVGTRRAHVLMAMLCECNKDHMEHKLFEIFEVIRLL